jgi:hypothetical protein
LETNCFGRQSQLSDIKLKRFPQGNLAHRQSVRSKGDDSKFLNGGRCHVDVNALSTLIFSEVTEKL